MSEPAPVPAVIPATSTTAQRWQWFAAAVAVVAAIYLLAPILTPFVVAALLAWATDPLVTRLERAGRSRTVGTLLVFVLLALLVVLLLLVLVPMIQAQVGKLIDWLPRLADWTSHVAVPWLEAKFHVQIASYVDPAVIAALVRSHWQQAGGVAATVVGGLSKSGLAILEWVATVALIPVLSFYFLRDWRVMLAEIRDLLPRPLEPTVVDLARQSEQMLGGFLRGQVSVMLSLGLIYGTGLWLAGIDVGLIIGVIAGLVSFVPYLGATVGIGLALVAALVQYGDLQHLLYVGGVFAAGHMVESFVLTPWLVGDRIGMHPVAVIFAIMAGGHLFGFLGVLLALPVAAVAMVLLRYAHRRYTGSSVYGAPVEDVSPPRIIVANSLEPTSAAPARSDA